MEKFNEQMDQSAMHMAEELIGLFELLKNATNYSTEEHVLAMERAPKHIGGVLATSLRTKVREAIPTLLPVALQTCLVSALYPTCNIAPVNNTNRKLFKAGKQQHGSVPLRRS